VDIHGRFTACGNDELNVIFTSSQINPTPGAWPGINIHPSADSCSFSHTTIEYANVGITCASFIIIDSSELRNCSTGVVLNDGIVTCCAIHDNANFGMLCSGPTDSLLFAGDNIITRNRIGIQCENEASPYITLNEICDNPEFGVFNADDNYWIYAENNWWGDSTGPRDTSNIDTLYNPNGLGDRVSDHVDYDPWIGFTPCNEDPQTKEIAKSTVILAPHPNPFFNTAVFTYDLAEKQHVICTVYNALGQAVRCLCEAQQSAGKYRIFWDGTDNLGRSLPAGVYLVRFETPAIKIVYKIIRID
jgi:hypothetical protein